MNILAQAMQSQTDVVDSERNNVTAPHLLSTARLNLAKSRVRLAGCSFVRIAQTCLGRSGGFCPISLLSFQGSRTVLGAVLS